MIFGKADLFLQKYLPIILYKPFFGCVRCMASVHGSISYILVNGFDWMIIPFVVCVSGLNVVLSYFLD